MNIGIVISRFNEMITHSLLESTIKRLEELGIDEQHIQTIWVPGAFEIPLVAKKMASSRKYDAIICLGAVIRGETPHFDYVAGGAASGITQASLETEVPILFGVLTTNTIDQALARCTKGGDLAEAAIEMIQVLQNLEQDIQDMAGYTG